MWGGDEDVPKFGWVLCPWLAFLPFLTSCFTAPPSLTLKIRLFFLSMDHKSTFKALSPWTTKPLAKIFSLLTYIQFNGQPKISSAYWIFSFIVSGLLGFTRRCKRKWKVTSLTSHFLIFIFNLSAYGCGSHSYLSCNNLSFFFFVMN